MTWEELVKETAQRAQTDPSDAARILNSFFDVVIAGMETEELIAFRPDFGYFELRPAGGGKMQGDRQSLPKARRTPVFKKSTALKKQLRQSDDDYLNTLRASGRADQANRLLRKQKIDHSA